MSVSVLTSIQDYDCDMSETVAFRVSLSQPDSVTPLVREDNVHWAEVKAMFMK